MEKLVLIDGHSILNRAFYGVPDLTNREGLHTNAVYGFLNIMFKILEEETPQYLTVAFDVKEKTFRHKMFEEYKGTRKPMPQELHEQVPVIKEILHAMQIRTIELPGYEADDLLGTIATLAGNQGMLVSLVSGDRDLLQLASDKIKIRIPKTKMGKTEIEDYNTEDVIQKYGITPKQIIDLKGLMGDTADNIPGVPGIGEKRATAIIQNFESVEGAISHIDEVTPNKARENLKEFKEQAILSKKLATIDVNAPIEYQFEKAKVVDFYTPEALEWIKRMEFKSMLPRFQKNVKQEEKKEDFEIIQNAEDWKEKQNEILNYSQEMIGLKLLTVECSNKEKFAKEADGQYVLFMDAIQENEVLGLSVSYEVKETEKNICILTNDEIKENDIQAFLEELGKSDKTLLMIDIKSQKKYLPFGSERKKLYDLSIAAYLLNPLQDVYDYESLAKDYAGITLQSRMELLGKKGLKEAKCEDVTHFVQYGCYDAQTSKNTWKELKEQLVKGKMYELYEKIEMPLLFTLYDMEKRGILVNREALKQYGEQLVGRINELENNIYDLAGEIFNINSPKQLGVILFEKLKLPFAKKTKTGYSTSADVLEKLKSEDPIVGLILEYRQLTKLKSTYADGLANYISDEDERIHGTFNQTITATGRISSTEPNLQNIPIRMELGRQIRKVFIPKPGFVFLDADYSQIELRVLAHMSDDAKLIEAYRLAQDIHAITASQVFHTPLEEVTSLQRSNAKAVNFGIVYGISSFGLGQDLNISRKEAEEYINKYFETYPSVKGFLDRLVKDAKETGYAVSLFNRKRPVPELSSSNFMQRSFGERIAMNSPIQGTAADIIKIAMIHVNERLKNAGLESQLILQVHDELLIETKIEEIDQVKQILEEEMKHAADLKVMLEIDVKQGNNWYEAK